MKYGFVYIWRDRKHKRYYIGAHWGTEDDGYVCSSPWMKQAYTKRAGDFKRRILARIYTSRQDMFVEEAKWQNLIKDEELKTRYYNIKRHGDRHWSSDNNTYIKVSEKISNTMKVKHQDPEYRKIYEEGQSKRDYTQTDETREKRRKSLLGKNKGKVHWSSLNKAHEARRGVSITEEHKQRIKDAAVFKNLNSKKIKCNYCDFVGNPGNVGRYHNEKCKKR